MARQRRDFDDLFLSILPSLFSRVAVRVRSRDAAEEIIHDVYVRLSTGSAWRTFVEHPNPIGYTMTTATNLIRDRWRRQQQSHEALRRVMSELRGDCDGGIAEHESNSYVSSMLHHLNHKEAAAIVLVDIVGHSLQEAGQLLGVTKATVHQNRLRGLERLRSRYHSRPQAHRSAA